MTPLRPTRRHALGRRISAAGLAGTRATSDSIDFTADRIMPLPPAKGAGGTIIPGRS
ncbi:hypothetical protein ACFW16_24175 [Inquilinus sp. NPDC058860]|uniref:hypothetical protein n=1 Tax=Inquilinus sp. NPDC058860 TaxID=3346652 RepID=UPI003678D594